MLSRATRAQPATKQTHDTANHHSRNSKRTDPKPSEVLIVQELPRRH